ncbi:MAG TPA: SusC/RagA family TonB-linked outer membrane protein [Phnomibacter sp.]|nr:SusC/RagA family TonB-linked outer membrane protein [Phnomibacter sp.]
MKRIRNSYTGSLCLFLVLAGSALVSTTVLAQTNSRPAIPPKIIPKVRVTVKDLMNGAALDSVFVSVGAKKGYTDSKGFIEFDSITAGSQIVVTKAGYIAASKKAKADLQLRLSARVESVAARSVENGFYSVSENQFPGAATVVSGNDLRKLHPWSFVEALKFYDPSLIVSRKNEYGDDPNVVPSVKIRGAYNFPASATISANSGVTSTGVQINPSVGDFVASNVANPNQPVILLNGIQVAWQTALDIDINRIDKVTILKDAAATAMFGVRGGTGVVLVQTKLPAKGVLNVHYSGQVQVATPELSSYNLLDASEKLQLEKTAGMYTNNQQLYDKRLYQVNKGINTDWLKIPTQTGIGQKHYVGVDGGDDDINYGIDFSYNNIEGVMKGSDRNNVNFGGYISTRINNLVISNYITYLQSMANNSPYGNFADYGRQNPYWNAYDSVTGDMSRILEEYTYQGKVYTYYNPAFNGVISTRDDHKYNRISNITSLKWKIGYGFNFEGRFGISDLNDEHNTFLPPSHTTYANYSPDDFFKRGEYTQVSAGFTSWEASLNLHYKKQIDKHQFFGSIGTNMMETSSESSGIVMQGFTSDKLSDLSFGNAYLNSRPATGKIATRLISGYFHGGYDYDNRYQADITANMDASSQFGENNRFAPHWSVGAGWNLHNENFLKGNTVLNKLRLRGSVGMAGSQYFQSYLGHTNYNYYTDRQYVPAGSGPGTRGIGLGAFLTAYGNKDLEAQQTAKQNIGLDVVLLKNRLALRVDAYRNKSTGLVLPVPVQLSTGFLNYSYYENLGAIENKGIEFDANYTIISNAKKGITWTVRVNGLHNQDNIVTTSEYINNWNAVQDNMKVDQTRPQPKFLEGQSLTGIWAVRSLGIDPATGMEKFMKADGSTTFTWDAADKVNVGDLTPDWIGSFGTAVTVKNISAGIYFNYQYGAKMYNQTLADRIENADLTYNVDARAASNRWTQPGDNALYKPLSLNGMVTSPTYATTRFVADNNFINCSAISIDYNFSNAIAQKIKAKYLKLGFIANNMFSTANQDYEKGVYYPMQRLYSFAVSAGF